MPELSPIRERPDLSPEDRLLLLEQFIAYLWDQVWWLSLSPEERAAYEADGYTAPVTHFYYEEGTEWRAHPEKRSWRQ